MQNARLDGLQDGVKIAGRNINNLRYPDDTTLMTESKIFTKLTFIKTDIRAGTSLAVSWLTLCASNAGGMDLISDPTCCTTQPKENEL